MADGCWSTDIPVPIKRSSRPEIDALVADLGADRPVIREAAIARLTVIGVRAVDRLSAVVASSSPSSIRMAALRALEGIGGPRAVKASLMAIDDGDEVVAAAAVGSVRASLRGVRGAEIAGRLAEVALNSERHQVVRLAAIQALSDLEPGTLAPLWQALASDANRTIRDEATAASTRAATSHTEQTTPRPRRFRSSRQ